MSQKIKKHLGGLICVGIILVVGAVAFIQHLVQAATFLDTDVKSATATSTVVYMKTTGITSTTTFETNSFDLVDINIQFTPSTTESVLNWYYEFSNDGIDWFGEDLAQVDSATSVSHASTTVTHTWKPNQTGTYRKNITLEPIGNRQTRVVFSVTGANGSVWTQVARKKDLSR
jgi:hypothetical protein